MAVPYLAPYEVAESLLACVCAELDAAQAALAPAVTVAGCPDRACVAVGSPAWEDCCDGELMVLLERTFAVRDFPNEDRTATDCYPQRMAGTYLIRVLRCACTSDEAAPTCACRAEEARQVTSDATAVARALTCCFGDGGALEDVDWVFDGASIVGPNGGCIGGETRVTVELDWCTCDQT